MVLEFSVGNANYSPQTCLGKFWTVMAFPPLLVMGLYCPDSVVRASFALPRSHHKEVRLTVGRI